MLGTVLLFVLLTPGILVSLNLGFKHKLAPVIIHAIIFAVLLANYRSIPLLNMLEPFQARRAKTAGGITNQVSSSAPIQNQVAANPTAPVRA